MGWLLQDGSCKHYDPITRHCNIYEDRPLECRVDERKPKDLSVKKWHDQNERYCDLLHKAVYGVSRERGEDCTHEVPKGKQVNLRVINNKDSTFACTSCGACCAQIVGPPVEKWKANNWILSNGACTFYDPVNKNCTVYQGRPTDCRVDDKNPLGPKNLSRWHDKMNKYCDTAHQNVYGVPRERDEDCTHEVVGKLELQLETTSTCNAACHFCPYTDLGRHGGLMKRELFEGIIDEAITIPSIHRYVLHGLGEPLLDPYLVLRVKYIRQRDPRSTIEIYTNGVYLTPDKFDALKKAGVTSIIISLNAVRQDQHTLIMGLIGKFDSVCKNIDYAIANKDRVAIQVHAVSNGDQFTEEDAFTFYYRWGYSTHEGYGICIRETNWAGDNRTTHQNWKPNEACGRALEQIYVMYDGRVSTCCLDPSGKQIFGDLSKQTIREVYNSEKYLKFREAHACDKADEYSICANCTRT